MGLASDHPLKEGELISLDNLIEEVQKRITQKKKLDAITRQAEGLKVVHGIKGDDVKASTTETAPSEPAVAAAAPTEEQPAPAAEKPADAPSS